MLVSMHGLGSLSLDSFAQQIQRVEGYYAPGTPGYPNGSLAYRNNNPGNLRYTSYYATNFGAVPGESNYAKFASYATGYAALQRQITLDANRGLTIRQMMAKYAPASDNNDPASYANTIATALGVSVDTPVAIAISGGALPAPPGPDAIADDGTAAIGAGLMDGSVSIAGMDVPVPALFFGGVVALSLVYYAVSRR